MSSVHDPRREQLIGLLQLPSHLQKTMKAILELGEAKLFLAGLEIA